MAGINDIGYGFAAGAPGRLAHLVDTILTSSTARVIVAQITQFRAPYAHLDSQVQTFNGQIPGAIAALGSAKTARVNIVNMHNVANSATDYHDENHPCRLGYNKLADQWNTVLPDVLREISSPTATVPGAPRNVVATAGNGQATITFDAPTSDGGAAIPTTRPLRSPAGRT